MNNWRGRILGCAVAAVFFAAAVDRAQPIPLGHASGFNTDMYFEPPNDEKVKIRLSGVEALPLPGGLYDVRQFQMEVFNTNGVSRMVAAAPQCTFAPLGTAEIVGVNAASPGHIELRSGDGRFRVSGDGFIFVSRQEATSLTLSNHVHTVMLNGLLKP